MQRTPGNASEDSTARQAAADADARAANAQQMVRNRDQTLAALQQTASTAQGAITSSAEDRAALHAQLDDLAAKVNALPKPPTIATGQAKTLAVVAIGASVDIVLPLSRVMPTDTYNVEVVPVSPGLLPGSAAISVKAKTKTSVTLTITATVAVAASSVVIVIAWG